jgi:hypothetical protein
MEETGGGGGGGWLAFCRSANIRVLAEQQNASYNKSVSRVNPDTGRSRYYGPKACANAKYIIAR